MLQKYSKWEPVVFYAMLILWLAPIWSVEFFVTGDGPCHLYNSKILLDWFNPDCRVFYKPYYFLNTNFGPNWLYNLITTPLLTWLGAGLTEKVFFTGYVLAFGLGFRYLIIKINPAARFLSILGLLFCYNKLLMMGFLNNSLSLAIWFWVVGYWWEKRDESSPSNLLKLAIIILLLFASHPMGFAYSGMMIGSLLVGLMFFEIQSLGLRESVRKFAKRTQGIVLAALPSLLLAAEFAYRTSWAGEKTTPDRIGTLEGLFHLTSLKTMSSTERDLATATSIACIVFFLCAVAFRIREKRWYNTDGLMLFVALVFFSIFNPPSSFSGGLEVPLRMGMIPFFALIFWASTAKFPTWFWIPVQLTAVILSLSFLAARMPIHQKASEYAKEVYSCNALIQDSTKLLTLNYAWSGRSPNGQVITNDNWMFTHVDCYLGTNKTMIVSDNYETHFWYFPVIARWETDMYGQTDKDGINFDNRPPRADILSYGRRTRTKEIDYVLILGSKEPFKDHDYTKEIDGQLAQAFDLIFTSEHNGAMLYKRK